MGSLKIIRAGIGTTEDPLITLRESVVTRGQVDLVQGALGRVRARQEGRATRTEGREKELS